jgi:NADH dehydrogenase [ubiquinone] 1 alpha subcomplex assembly factor 6
VSPAQSSHAKPRTRHTHPVPACTTAPAPTAGVASREGDHAASHLGKAIGLSLLLRGTPFQASRRRSYLPLELCAAHGVSQEDVYRGSDSEGVRDVAFAVASVAMGHLQEARKLVRQLPRAAPPVLQQGTLAGLYLRALQKAGFNVFDPALGAGGGASPLRRVLALKWNMLRGTV